MLGAQINVCDSKYDCYLVDEQLLHLQSVMVTDKIHTKGDGAAINMLSSWPIRSIQPIPSDAIAVVAMNKGHKSCHHSSSLTHRLFTV